MERGRRDVRSKGRPIALAALAASLLVLPSAGQSLGAISTSIDAQAAEISRFAPFTPASVDPELAQRVARNFEQGLRFTPAGHTIGADRTLTVAVRIDESTARAISVRSAARSAAASDRPGLAERRIAVAPTRYDLGIARGYQSFSKSPELAELPGTVRRMDIPDLAEYRPAEPEHRGKPSRFEPRISLEQDEKPGQAPRTLESLGEQSVEVEGAYRVTRNLDVTAGVRLSQDRDRLDPLTDEVQDSQAVYVGTQFRF